MIYLVTKLGEVTRAWGGSWADCVREGVNVGKALYPWEPFGRILVEVLSDGSIRELDNIFSCRHPVAITTEEIEGAVVAALESIDMDISLRISQENRFSITSRHPLPAPAG